MSAKSDPLSPGFAAAGRYEVVRLIGAGGMGAVYEAVDRNLDKPVALKTLDPLLVSEKDAMRRFRQEAQSAARIKHDNVCDVTDFGVTDEGVPFLVMELLEGEPLTGLMERQGKLAPERAVAIMRQVVSALGSAHMAGIVHRDLKPDNIFLTRSSSGDERVKIIDFGLAKVLDATSTGTATGRLLGTLAYMSPEQANGQSDRIDHTTDVWSAGVILYQALTGTSPFTGETMREILAAVVIKEPPPVNEVVPEIPAALSDVVTRALDKEQDERFVDMDEFDAALSVALKAPEAPIAPAPAKSSGHSRMPLVALIVIVLFGALGAAWWFFRARPVEPGPTESSPVASTKAPPPAVPAPADPPPAPPAPAPAPAPVEPAPAPPHDAATPDAAAQPLPDPEIDVAVVGVPAGARVTFDGRDVRDGTLRGAPGERGELRVTAAGYRDYAEQVALPASGSLDVGARLRRIEPPPAPAEIERPRPQPDPPRSRPTKRGRLVGGYDDG